jgi:hypothetical protein
MSEDGRCCSFELPIHPCFCGSLVLLVSFWNLLHGVSLHSLMRIRASRDTSPRSKSQLNNMEPKESPSAHGVDALPSTNEQRTTEHTQIAVSALELRISEQNFGV